MAVMTMATSQAHGRPGPEPAAAPDGGGAAAAHGTFDTLNPATGQVIAAFPLCGREDAHRAVERAREAAGWWAGLGWRERRRRLLDWKSHLTRHMDELAEVVHEENGKPVADAKLEIILTILHVDWAARHAQKVLGPHRVFSGLAAMNHTSTVEYQPLGVVGVIGPWNYPVFTPMGSIAYALAAGNAVVFKPSEYTPAVGDWLVRSFGEAAGAGAPAPVLQLLTGRGETGAALAASAVDKIAFTGSAATARTVMATAAQNLTPVIAECGGKDALIVDAGADLDAAADAAAWGALSNAGQTCIGIERVYVTSSVYDEFLAKLTQRVAGLQPGSDAGAAYGPITMPGQLDVIRKHLADAEARGGHATSGGPAAVEPPYVRPVILTDVPEDAPAVTEETFGPTMTVRRVENLDEGVRLANASSYGLGSAIFAKGRRAMQAARELRSGMTAINSVIAFAIVPGLPFGGVGESGFGRIHGADGLREFARPKAITSQWMRPPINLTSFSRTDADLKRIAGVIGLLHGRRKPRGVPAGR
jgi:acyl-CoA reductase-like NAD-dependent aldehyde dehydrogenase